jgi:hypothetical protein
MKAKNPLAKKAMAAYKAGGVKKAAPKYKKGGASKSMRRYQDLGEVKSTNGNTDVAPAAPMTLEEKQFAADQAAAAAKAADIKSYENMMLTGNRRQRNYAKDRLTTSGVITGKKPRTGQTLATVTGSLLGGFGAVAPYLFNKKGEEKLGGSIKKKRGGRAADSATTNTTKGQMPPMYKKGGAAKPMMKRTGKKK